LPKLDIQSREDAQILIIGGNLQVVKRGIGAIRADLDRGLYKIKVERGGGTVERLLDLEKDELVYLFVENFPTIAPLQPLLGPDWANVETIATQAMKRQHHRAELAGYLGSSGDPGLLVLAHRQLAEGIGGPLEGLQVAPRSLTTWLDMGSLRMDEAVAAQELWGAAWFSLHPGCYLLRISDGAQTILQALPVAPGWQTRVFLRRRKWIGADKAPDSGQRRDWIDVSIQMARRNTQVVYFDHLETVEVARNALELVRPIFVSKQLIDSLLYDKFENPIAGITGLHLFLEALEREQTPEPDPTRQVMIDPAARNQSETIIRTVIANLERLLSSDGTSPQPYPADLVALKIRSSIWPDEKMVVEEPPMFWASWDVLRRNSGPNEGVEISPDLWRRIGWGNAWGPYLAWPEREASLEDFLDGQLRSWRGRSEGVDVGSERRSPEAASLVHSGDAAPPLPLLEGDELVKALGIPDFVARFLPRAGNMPMDAYVDKLAADLGKLILKLNPHTNNQRPGSNNSTGEMDIYVGRATGPTLTSTGTISDVELDIDTHTQEWSFRGQPQNVRMAARIKYRYPVLDADRNVLFWVEDYILVGFQGSMGG
jgi:hypothetical protein